MQCKSLDLFIDSEFLICRNALIPELLAVLYHLCNIFVGESTAMMGVYGCPLDNLLSTVQSCESEHVIPKQALPFMVQR